MAREYGFPEGLCRRETRRLSQKHNQKNECNGAQRAKPDLRGSADTAWLPGDRDTNMMRHGGYSLL